jgi:hypothetical protein
MVMEMSEGGFAEVGGCTPAGYCMPMTFFVGLDRLEKTTKIRCVSIKQDQTSVAGGMFTSRLVLETKGKVVTSDDGRIVPGTLTPGFEDPDEDCRLKLKISEPMLSMSC